MSRKDRQERNLWGVLEEECATEAKKKLEAKEKAKSKAKANSKLRREGAAQRAQHAAATPTAATSQPVAAAADVSPLTAATAALAVSNVTERRHSRAGSDFTGASDSTHHALTAGVLHASTAGVVHDSCSGGKATAGTDAHRHAAPGTTPPHWLMCPLTKVPSVSSHICPRMVLD